MEIKIIDENHGNPFKYFDNEQNIPGFPRNHGKRMDIVKSTMSGLLDKLGLQTDIRCLEVGAGHNPNPSQSLSQLGASVVTLDADWESERHSDISVERFREIKKELGKDMLIPRIGGRNGKVVCYMGDVAFLKDQKSPLKDEEFDLIYFWGSLDWTGICSSVEGSRAAERQGVEIEHKDRILRPLPAVKKDGTIISVAGYFCGHQFEDLNGIGYQNSRLADLGLYWALAGDREAKVLGFLTQSPQSTIKRLGLELNPETEETLCKNPLERIVQLKRYSLFGEEDNYTRLREAQERLSHDRKKLENLGIIDAVFVSY